MADDLIKSRPFCGKQPVEAHIFGKVKIFCIEHLGAPSVSSTASNRETAIENWN